jgi:hypothetical protein
MISLIVPWAGGNPEALRRTLDSGRGIVSETVVVHQKLFDDDTEIAQSMAGKVIVTDWNETFKEGGFALLPNAGASAAKGPWMILLGTGETIAEQYHPIKKTLEESKSNTIFLCDHHGDIHRWGRCWNPSGGTYWSGPIHEECGNGPLGKILFRMQDYAKEPHQETFRNECIKWWKNCSYHANYFELLHHPEKLGFCNEGWLKFVTGASESIEEFVESNKDLMEAGWDGDRQAFYEGVSRRMDEGLKPEQVNHNPTGQPMSEGALPAPA